MWGAAIGAVGSMAGAVISGGNKRKAIRLQNEYNQQASALNWERYQQDRDLQYQRNYDDQKEFAQNSAGWQMQDIFNQADASGIHRLAALGSSGSQYTPAGGSAPPGSIPNDAGGGDLFMGDAVGEALSKIGDAVDRRKEQEEAAKNNAAQRDLLEAETELIRNQSRSIIRQARAAELGGPTSGGVPSAPQSVTENIPPEPVVQRFQLPDGSIRNVTVGPDLDEVVSGGVIYVYDKLADLWVVKDKKVGREADKRSGRQPAKKTVIIPPAESAGSSSRRNR